MAERPPQPTYEWDEAKAAANLEKHGVPFKALADFDWATAIEAEDTRYDYGEVRMQALGKIHDRYHVVVYTPRENALRIISLRKANKRERP